LRLRVSCAKDTADLLRSGRNEQTQLQLYPTQAKTGLEWATLWAVVAREIPNGEQGLPLWISPSPHSRVAHSSPVLA